MPQANRGTKRRCANCGAPYYDLSRDPAICPKCETPFEPRPAAPLRAFRGPVRMSKYRAAEKPKIEEPAEEAEDVEVEAFTEDDGLPALDQDESEASVQPDDEEPEELRE